MPFIQIPPQYLKNKMIDKNYLGHNLVEGWEIQISVKGRYFICTKCDSKIFYSSTRERYNIIENNVYKLLHLTCEEMIIKKLLE